MEASSASPSCGRCVLRSSMANPVPPTGLLADGGWDIEFTRLAREVQGRIRTLVQDLMRRFQAVGLGCDVRVRLVGQRGLLCIVDMTLVDGMTVAREPAAALDIRLLDACGDPAASRSLHVPNGPSPYQVTSDGVLAADQVGPCATAIHLLVMGSFGMPTSTQRGRTSSAAPRRASNAPGEL